MGEIKPRLSVLEQRTKDRGTKAQRVELERSLVDQSFKLEGDRFRINEFERITTRPTLRYSKALFLSSGGRVTSNWV